MSNAPALQDVVEKVCSMAADFYRRGDVSLLRLLADSGYETVRDAVTVDLLREHLQVHPKLIDYWEAHCSDKRCDGWLFDGKREVWLERTGRRRAHVQRFDNVAEACAVYVRNEVESLRENPYYRPGLRCPEDASEEDV